MNETYDKARLVFCMQLGCRDTKVCFSMLFGRRGVVVVFKQVCIENDLI